MMESFEKLINTIEYLRSEKGCPWDRAQTMESYKTYILEEVYELFNSIENKDLYGISEELGDLLLNILLMATILKENGGDNISKIIDNINKKIINRHPHVFGDNKEYEEQKAYEVWIREKKRHENKGVFSDIPINAPALTLAYLISKRAHKSGFGFDSINQILDKVLEEIEEIKDAVKDGCWEKINKEMGDLFFSSVNLSVFLNIHPEDALRSTCIKFLKRLKYIEEELNKMGKDFFSSDRELIEKLWEEAK